MKTLEALATKTLTSPHGEFEVTVDSIKLSDVSGVFITVEWSVHHNGQRDTQKFDLPRDDRLLSGMKKDLNRERIGTDILFFADYCTNEAGDKTEFEICERGTNISDESIFWCEATQGFM